jgi:membrane fusion protein (multidrug efflux system)
MRPLIISAIIIILLIIAKLFFWDKSSEKSEPKNLSTNKKEKPVGGKGPDMKPMSVNVVVVGLNKTDRSVFSSGTTVASDEVELKSEISGIIVKLNIPEGKIVSKGFLIAKIKDSDILAQLKKVELEEKLAYQIEARQKKLLDINAISKEEFEISQNKVLTLRADKELLRVQLAKTEIRAPFGGKVGLKNISLGSYVTPATIITSIVQFNPIRIDFTVPEKYINNIKPGLQINFQTDSDPNQRVASVIAISPKVDETLRTMKVRATSSNSDNSLLPGMFVKVVLNLGSSNSIMIPSEAVIPVIDGKKVFVKRNGKAEEIKIETGLRNSSSLEVLSGLNIGDSLITTNLMTLKGGNPVFAKNK